LALKKFVCLAAGVAVLALLGACSSNPKVSRVDAEREIDLSGRWNDTDVRKVCDSLIEEILSAPGVTRVIDEYRAKNGGALPAVIVGTFRNTSSEHIDTTIISRLMRTALINSGRLEFVAGGEAREELRSEKQDQQGNASEETAAALANETGAVFMLNGEVKAMVDRAGNVSTRTYFVSATLTNIETSRLVWEGANDEIKKVIKQPRARL
jgi:uncharacterized protein (TIGR02722 family)